jgi:hypothetical protein
MIRIALFAVFHLSLSAVTAWAYCSEPSASLSLPDAPSYSKPSVPYCLSSFKFSGEHTCDEWEISAYQRAVNQYVQELQEYSDEAAAVAREAVDYAQEAAEFAQCEASEAVGQHK